MDYNSKRGGGLKTKLFVAIVSILVLITGCTGSTTASQTVTETVTQTKTNNLVMTFSSSGNSSTPSFTVNSSRWKVDFSANYDCVITLSFSPSYGRNETVSGGLTNGQICSWSFNEYYGYPLFFNVETEPVANDNEWWTFSVIEVVNSE